jgi:hypothetical protein
MLNFNLFCKPYISHDLHRKWAQAHYSHNFLRANVYELTLAILTSSHVKDRYHKKKSIKNAAMSSW